MVGAYWKRPPTRCFHRAMAHGEANAIGWHRLLMYIEIDMQDRHQPKEIRKTNTEDASMILHVEPAVNEPLLSTAERMYRFVARRCM